MTPETVALFREALMTLIGIVEAGLVLVGAMLFAYLVTCAWTAWRA